MGLFENLFKPRPDGTLERIVEAPLKASGLVERAPDVEGEEPPDPTTAFLQPKGYAPGTSAAGPGAQNPGFVPVLPSAKRPPGPERKTEPSSGGPSTVVLTVGDVLPRIPVAFLRPGPRDLKRELRFQIDDLVSDITRGRPAIALSCIAEQCPELFHRPISDDEDMAIRLPLQKLVEQVGRQHGYEPPAMPTPPSMLGAPPVAEAPPPRPPVTAPPVIAPPVVAPPMVAEVAEPVPDPPVAPAPVAPVVPPLPIAPEPVAEIAEPPPVPVPERVAQPGMIDLSLAAIVAKVPRGMLADLPPQLADHDRISLPFAPIERQLGTGDVSVPGRVFWDALPPLLRHHFLLREDLNVPIPLEEIFQNLPVGEPAEKVRFDPMPAAHRLPPEGLAPVVLAPAPMDELTPPLNFDGPPITPVPVLESTPPPEPPVAITEAPAIPAPVAPPIPEPAVVAEAAPAPPAEDVVLAASAPEPPAPESAVNAAPDAAQPGVVHLQPFRVFHLPTPDVEVEPEADASIIEPPILAPPMEAPAAAGAAQILEIKEEPSAAPIPEADPTAALVPPEPAPAPAPAVEPAPEPAPRFSVLPAPAPEEAAAASPPEPDSLVAFTPDQPPPLQVEAPAVAVAVLRASVPAPMELPAVALATVSVQPPPMFRPLVLPPPVTGAPAPPPVQLAPTLAGSGSIPGMISLSPSADVRPPASFPPPSAPPLAPTAPVVTSPPALVSPPVTPPPAVPPAPVAKASAPASAPVAPPPVTFTAPPRSAMPAPSRPPSAPPAPAPPVAKAPPVPAAAAPVEGPEPFHLHIPPLPSTAAAAAPSVEHAPPSIPLSRFDQHSLQSLFMTEETLDLPRVARLAAALPGIQACVIASRGETHSGGQLPGGFELSALRGLSPQVDAAADRLPIGQLKNFTLYGEQYSISYFERTGVCLCAIHRARSFVPGVREKLVAVVDELARG